MSDLRDYVKVCVTNCTDPHSMAIGSDDIRDAVDDIMSEFQPILNAARTEALQEAIQVAEEHLEAQERVASAAGTYVCEQVLDSLRGLLTSQEGTNE